MDWKYHSNATTIRPEPPFSCNARLIFAPMAGDYVNDDVSFIILVDSYHVSSYEANFCHFLKNEITLFTKFTTSTFCGPSRWSYVMACKPKQEVTCFRSILFSIRHYYDAITQVFYNIVTGIKTKLLHFEQIISFLIISKNKFLRKIYAQNHNFWRICFLWWHFFGESGEKTERFVSKRLRTIHDSSANPVWS